MIDVAITEASVCLWCTGQNKYGGGGDVNGIQSHGHSDWDKTKRKQQNVTKTKDNQDTVWEKKWENRSKRNEKVKKFMKWGR